MSKVSQEVYHCPSCGALAAVDAENQEAPVCGECGFEFKQRVPISPRAARKRARAAGGFVQRDVASRRRLAERVEPVLSSELLPVAGGEEAKAKEGTGEEHREVVSDDGRKRVVRRRRKRRRTRMAPLLFLCAWATVVMLVVILVKYFGGEQTVLPENPRELAELERRAKEMKAAAYVEKNWKGCWAALTGFLSATTTEERTQFVRDARRLAGTMSSYYAGHLPWSLPDEGKLVVKRPNLLIGDGRSAIEVVWKVAQKSEESTKTEGENEEGSGPDSGEAAADVKVEAWQDQPEVETVFVKQSGRWLLDWEAFVRYSTEDWERFVKRAGDRGGVFRVYMREGRPIETTGPPMVQVQFLPARTDRLKWRQKSEWIRVPLESENGRRIDYILKRARKKNRALGESILRDKDAQEGLHRVRVSLQWTSQEGEERLVLQEVLAGNWHGLGFEENFEKLAPAEGEGTTKEGQGEADRPPEEPEGEEVG